MEEQNYIVSHNGLDMFLTVTESIADDKFSSLMWHVDVLPVFENNKSSQRFIIEINQKDCPLESIHTNLVPLFWNQAMTDAFAAE